MTDFDLSKVNVVSFIPRPFPELVAKSKTYGVNPVGKWNALRSVFNYSSEMGNELVFPITLGTGANAFQLPGEPEISIRGNKNMIVTSVGHGSKKRDVIEEVNLNNWEILIKGSCFTNWTDDNSNETERNLYPAEQLINVLAFFKQTGGVKIACDLLEPFGITQIVIKEIDVPYQRASPTEQPYTLRCISDEEFEFDYKQEQQTNQT